MDERLKALEEIIDADDVEITEDTVLDDLDEWDSLTKLALIVYFQEELGKTISTDDLKSFTVVKDILDAMK